MAGGTLPTLNTLWIGGRLSYVERLCLQSMLDVGHSVVLFHYDEVFGVPRGVEVRDAREVLDDLAIATFFGRGSPKNALIADVFRYELMRRDLGYWVDLDIYVLKPLHLGTGYVFGWEDQRAINGAVLHLPGGSPLLNRVLSFIYQRPIIPPWWSFRRKAYQHFLSSFGADKTAGQLPWGSFGPTLLTYFVRKEGYENRALPKEVFYPLHYKRSEDLLNPNIDVEAAFTDQTLAIHLWNKSLQLHKLMPPVPDSFLHRLCERHGIDFDVNAH